jgi:hypothetical protein
LLSERDIAASIAVFIKITPLSATNLTTSFPASMVAEKATTILRGLAFTATGLREVR